MVHRSELFVEYLTRTLGDYTHIAGIEPQHAPLGMVLAIAYQDYPEPGLLTGFTYGLSEASHPEWTEARPELTITVRSTDVSWANAVAWLVDWHRTDHAFGPGSLFHYGKPIAADSAMDSFLVFDPAIGEGDPWKNIPLGPDTISLRGVYPLYSGEVALIQKVGIRKFTGLREYDPLSVDRPDLSQLYRVR